MTIPVWVAISIAVLVALAPITQGRGDKVDSKQLEKFRAKVGLPLPPALAGPVLARIGHRERWAMTGGVAGIAAGALAATLTHWTDGGGVLVMLGVALGASIGGGFATVQSVHQPSGEAPRVARPVSTEVDDYVPHRHLLAARIVTGLAVVANAIELVVVAGRPDPAAGTIVTLIVCTLAAVAVAALTEVVAKLLVRRPQRASTDLELAWDDVLRADAGHQLVVSQVVVGGLVAVAAPITAGLLIDLGNSAAARSVISVVVAGISLALLFAGLALTATGWLRHPLQRLWPGRTFDETGSAVRMASPETAHREDRR